MKNRFLLLAALLLCIGVQFRPCLEYEIAGEPAGFCVGLIPACRAERAARSAAEEILPTEALLPEIKTRLRLRLRRPEGDAARLSDALLRATAGVMRADEVRLDGARLGWVADGGELRESLARYIANTLPTWATGGMLSRESAIRSLYTREGRLTPTRDMLLLLTGAAPVFYCDDAGRVDRA